MKTVKQTVIELCAERGVSIYKLEKDLGFGNGTIRKWDANIPNTNKLKAVADYFGVTSDFLMGRDDSSSTSIADFVDNITNAKTRTAILQRLSKEELAIIAQACLEVMNKKEERE